MLSGGALDAAVAKLISRPLRGVYFRAMHLAYSHDPLGKNRPINAQRFNLAGGSRMLYLGSSAAVCLAEIQALGAPFMTAIIPVNVTLQAVVDLRDPLVLRTLETTPAELARNFRLSPGPTPSQELGESVARSGLVDGLLYESLASPGGEDLVVVERALKPNETSLVVDDLKTQFHDRLP
jgi:hypothetical protein